MDESQPPYDAYDPDDEEIYIEPGVEKFIKEQYANMAVLIQDRVDSLEQQFSNLMMGYLELTAAYEAMFTWYFFKGQEPTPEQLIEAEAFAKHMKNIRNSSIRWLNDFTRSMDQESSEFTSTLADMVRSSSTDSDTAERDSSPSEPEPS